MEELIQECAEVVARKLLTNELTTSRDIARAVIPLVLEHAAKVAVSFPLAPFDDPIRQIADALRQQAREITEQRS